MGAYIQMIANRGRGPQRNLLSPESFELFSKRHIKAEEFGPGASYGYGIEERTLRTYTAGADNLRYDCSTLCIFQHKIVVRIISKLVPGQCRVHHINGLLMRSKAGI